MKRVLLAGCLGMGLAGGLFGQTQLTYENDSVVICPPSIPPQIDAVTFINRNVFVLDFTNISANSTLFETANTLNYTNYGFMSANPGFQFTTAPATAGKRRMAANFYNAGVIQVGQTTNTSVFGTFGNPKLIVWATNLVNPGTNWLGFDSVCTFRGQTLDLRRGTFAPSETVASGTDIIFTGNIFDGYWGSTNNLFNPVVNFEATLVAYTPPHEVTNRNNELTFKQLVNNNGLSYVSDLIDASGSNRVVRAVFLVNTNDQLPSRVFFPNSGGIIPGDITVEYSATSTNSAGDVVTNRLYLCDSFILRTNHQLVVDGFAGSVIGRPTFKPDNFQFIQGDLSGILPSPAISGPIPFGTFIDDYITNEYSAYEALFLPSSRVLSDVQGQDVTNLPGRVEIAADKVLDLSRARVRSANYLELKSTNHFVGSARANISSPFSVINLRNTNGLLTITNLMGPSVAKPEGTLDLYAARWTNFVGGVTNTYHVLFVNSQLAPRSPSRVEDLILRTTSAVPGLDSIVLNDVMNVTRSLTLDTSRLTIATNEPGSPTANGALLITDPKTVWSSSTPRLQYLTNFGVIQCYNAFFFGGSRTSPYYTSNFNQPYLAFVNAGAVTNSGSLIWANTFMNWGVFSAQVGDINLQQSRTAILTNGAFLAPAGSIGIQGGSLLVSNHLFTAGGPITLSLTDTLDDGSLSTSVDVITNKNFWLAKGFNLLTLPTRGSLLATTVTNLDPTYAEIVNTWAGRDYGPNPDGFGQNSAVGHLILDGRDPDSLFTFAAAGISNAIYIDCIEFRNSLETNRDAAGNFTGVQINPNMKVYYGQALANGVSIAEKLSGKNGGGFVWVSNYNTGFFSSTNLVYPDGTTNRLNTALVTSCDIDSDGDGIVNCLDPDPINVFRGSSLAMTVTLTDVPTPRALVSWNSVALSTNFLYSSSSAMMTNCQLVTNFVLGPIGGRVTVTDLVKTNGPLFYRARVDPPQH